MELLRNALADQQSLSATFNVWDSGLIAEHTVKLRPDNSPARFSPALSA